MEPGSTTYQVGEGPSIAAGHYCALPGTLETREDTHIFPYRRAYREYYVWSRNQQSTPYHEFNLDLPLHALPSLDVPRDFTSNQWLPRAFPSRESYRVNAVCVGLEFLSARAPQVRCPCPRSKLAEGAGYPDSCRM